MSQGRETDPESTPPHRDGADSDVVRGSGDRAVAGAAERAKETAGRNIANLPDLPLPDTANLRLGPDLHPGMLALLPMVGVWRGEGEGRDPETGDYRFGQQIVVSHDGGNYLSWESRSWRLDDTGGYAGPDQRETGFWRVSGDGAPGSENEEALELLLAHASGVVELFYGEALTQSSWELATDVVIRSQSGELIGGAKRLYGIVEDGDLAYVEERVIADGALEPRFSARLQRYIG
ncbi:FABP family protein [Rhodococcus xishaensis]|uniref:Ferric nitrobindin-like protein n=1 Tax=Rhodococcus xishaensis TaxID=2487364 RepID=A0A438APY1_9NOCA|nr:FABP family protein [Rhodococcus xishaensis]RVW00720.1 FABP family protein [Rhodococcus xishaensis]